VLINALFGFTELQKKKNTQNSSLYLRKPTGEPVTEDKVQFSNCFIIFAVYV
jgi:hypothetical protein